MCHTTMFARTAGVSSRAATPHDSRPRPACAAPGAFLIRGADGLPPAAQVRKALSVLAPAALGAALLFSLGPAVSWIVFATGWLLFPTVGVLTRGLAGVARSGDWASVLPLPAPARLATRVAPDAGATVARIAAAAHRVPTSAARDEALRVHAAAERVAVALPALDAPTAGRVVARYLTPTADLLERYAALAAGRAAAAETLSDVEARGLPALAAKLDALGADLRRNDAVVSFTGYPGADDARPRPTQAPPAA